MQRSCNSNTGKCFALVNGAAEWSEAEAFCRNQVQNGTVATLASITSQGDANIIGASYCVPWTVHLFTYHCRTVMGRSIRWFWHFTVLLYVNLELLFQQPCYNILVSKLICGSVQINLVINRFLGPMTVYFHLRIGLLVSQTQIRTAVYKFAWKQMILIVFRENGPSHRARYNNYSFVSNSFSCFFPRTPRPSALMRSE